MSHPMMHGIIYVVINTQRGIKVYKSGGRGADGLKDGTLSSPGGSGACSPGKWML